MDASLASLVKPNRFFCNVPSPSWYSSFPIRKPATRLVDYSLTFVKLPSLGSSTARRRAMLLVFSLVRRPPPRRNSLRKKLIPANDQVRLSPQLPKPESNLENLCLTDHESNENVLGMNMDGVEESEGAGDCNKFGLSSNSALWDKLENWVDRFKEDSEFWGIGTGPIFTIFQASDGNVTRVSVNEVEILKRHRIQALSLEKNEKSLDLRDLSSKISRARIVAKEIEIGAYHMPRNSSIAKFVVDGNKSSLVCLFHALSSRREALIRTFPWIGLAVLCYLCVLGMARKLFSGYNGVELTREEAEMLRRKKKSRMEREGLQKGSVEVLQNVNEFPLISGTAPQLDRDELIKNIVQVKNSGNALVLSDPLDRSTKQDFDRKVREIRDMVRKVHEVEHQNQSSNSDTTKQDDLNSTIVDTQHLVSENHSHYKENSAKIPLCNDNAAKTSSYAGHENNAVDCEFSQGEISLNKIGTSRNNDIHVIDGQEMSFLTNSQLFDRSDSTTEEAAVFLNNKVDVRIDKEDANSVKCEQINESLSVTSTNKRGKPRVITSLKEANEYLSTKCRSHVGSVQREHLIHSKRAPEVLSESADRISESADRSVDLNYVLMRHNGDFKLDCVNSETMIHNESCQDYKNRNYFDHTYNDKQVAKSKGTKSDNTSMSVTLDQVDGMMLKKLPCTEDEIDIHHVKHLDHVVEHGRSEHVDTSLSSMSDDSLEDFFSKASISSNSTNFEDQNESLQKTDGNSWVEDNFQKFDSIIEKLGIGFKDNFTLAKVKAQEDSLSSADVGKLCLWGEDEELEWMKDENLLEIVFQVRENELAGRDPFYSMNADDQQAFFLGLERKAEKVNEKLAGMHEWMHSKIENLDYGTDGISLADPLEKIIPRWKGPPIDQDPEFLKKFVNTRNSVMVENIRNLDYISGTNYGNVQKSENTPNSDGFSHYSAVNSQKNLSEKGTSTPPKTLIECSDGSSRSGKKKSKEQWQHTKKWSRGFLEVYNTETDPEVKSILKDMGKDLDRWITDKEIKDAADQMNMIPKRKRRFIEQKMNKVKREVEKYGAQAVVSKYKEYAVENEEDYLWWLDLPFILCVELYSVEDDVPRIGFYSLEMAEEFELNPKQYHVIAFEDAGDSKNLCHILQAQMDVQGNGKAFVVARPPKDAFREAKANGFCITLIRKGEIKLNVDQTLDEVEEELKEHGSKVYHDKIMKDRGVNIHSLMKGVIVANKSGKR